MDKNGKLFGKISVLDILVVLLVLMVAAGTAYRFLSPLANLGGGRDEITYTVVMKGVREFTLEYYDIGFKCFDKRTNEYIGDITAIRDEPNFEYTYRSDGEVVFLERPGLRDIYIDIKAPGLETGIAYYANGTYEIKAGSEIQLVTRWMEVTGRVASVSIGS